MLTHSAATQWCDLCDGPCREPFRPPPIHDRYPFLRPEQIAMTQQPADQPPAPTEPPVRRGGRRMGRLQETTAREPTEDRMAPQGEDR